MPRQSLSGKNTFWYPIKKMKKVILRLQKNIWDKEITVQ